ncbi:hypothetical protein NSK_001005 [Nannochloropsis salina CCMP1776]|jgi:splicing factor 3B subunit 3|uniref:DNA damage-binding protein 1 n=2 Tax=Nannochloropsis salina CCMP1776 TaxID=1027361 RepID=A0A4D9DDK9_9STRA|nr:hypothetical protein NSK_001005 [Nannochloropsis salina CCMP1776]|eukprot:TFJ87655.1 hypothetical protein NSK_001005 [Nannochloropsis salina CCMP1776]
MASPNIAPPLNLLNLTMQRPGYIHAAVSGNFSSPKAQEVVVIRGTSYLELLRSDAERFKITPVCTFNTFCNLRCLLTFRQVGTNKDYLVVGSDSGRITILEYVVEANEFRTVHCETFGKTGCRRIVPGQFLAADPLGRAIMISALEKQKLVYVMNRDAGGRLTISSPLEAHRSHALVYATVGLDVGTENPIFAAIEKDYSEADQDPTGEAAAETYKQLVYYELDLGLNHVIRKWAQPIASTACSLLAVPGERFNGPGGVLILSENWVAYTHQDHPELRTPIPRRAGQAASRGTLLTAAAMHRQKDVLFYLLQSEFGDLYKVTLDLNQERTRVQNINMQVFDTIPPANGLCITKTGLLFCASEFANHILYQFQGIDNPEAVAADSLDEEALDDEDKLGDTAEEAASVAPTFTPAKQLKNLAAVDRMESLAPVTGMHVADLAGEDAAQLYTLCGRGGRSSLRILRHGLQVVEEASSDLPGRPNAVWTIKGRQDEAHDRFIVVSFANATLVFSIGDQIEEVTDSGFLGTAPTLEVKLLADNAMLQVHTHGIRHIRPGRPVNEWKTPGRKSIEQASANERQVAIALEGGDVVYFELDAAGMLMEVASKEVGLAVSCLDLGPVPQGRVGSSFLAVGGYDSTVRILSLEQASLLTQRSMLQLSATAESVCLAEMAKEGEGAGIGAGNAVSIPASSSSLFLNVGLSNGIMQRLALDPLEGTLSDSRQRFLGAKPVKLLRVDIEDRSAVLALSSRAWLSYNHHGRFFQTPLSYQGLDYASGFASEYIPEGLVAVTGSSLRIITIQNFGNMFNQTEVPLRYTPRQMVQVPGSSRLVLIESDHNEYNETERAFLASAGAVESDKATDKEEGEEPTKGADSVAAAAALAAAEGALPPPPPPEEGTEDEDGAEGETFVRGPLPPVEGKWASCIRIVDGLTGETLELVELALNEAAISLTTVAFHDRGGEVFICVGTATDLCFHPRKHSAAAIHVYRLFDNRLVLLHKTEVEDVPKSLAELKGFGRLLAGLGPSLRMYDLGKKKLLKKCENRNLPNLIVGLQTMGDRIYVSDVLDSVHFVKYRRLENALVIFADDTSPRTITACCTVDYDTIAGGDKVGNVFLLRLPEKVSDDVDNPTGNRVLWDTGRLNGAPNKLDVLAHFYVGEVVTALQKVSLVPGGQEVILYATVAGTIGALVPFSSRRSKNTFFLLEMEMRKEASLHFKRDHIAYRSYYTPVKEVIDGDLCELFRTLSAVKRRAVALEVLDRTPGEVVKLLEDFKNTIL